MIEQRLRRWTAGMVGVALSVAACGSSSDAPAPAPSASGGAPSASGAPAASGTPSASGRLVEITAGAEGFSPATVEAKPGEALILRFTRTTPSGCMSTVALPGLGVRKELPMSQPVDVAVTAPAGGSMPIECGMGMFQGQIVVGAAGSAAVAAPSSAVPHADHSPRHGGIVTMEGDLHVEIVVAPDGAVDLYLSDSTRRPIPPAEATGTLQIDRGAAGKQVLPLVADAGRGSLSVRAAAPDQNVEYTWNVQARGQKTAMTLAVPAGGTAKLAGPTGAGPEAGGGPPEVRRALGKGQVALSLDPGGRATLRLLDGAGAQSTARDVQATIRIGGKETAFSYDPAKDAMRADVGPVKGDHADALVTITAPGGKPTAVRVSFHMEHASKSH